MSIALGSVERGRVPTLTIHIPARVEVVPQCTPDGLIRVTIVVPDAPPHICRRLLAVIYSQRSARHIQNRKEWRTEGHRREHVVHDVEVRDVVEEDATDEAQEVAVDGGDCAARGCPCATAVDWDFGVCVVQKGDHDNPVVHEQPGHAVELRKLPDPDCRRDFVEDPCGCANSEVGKDNRVPLVGQKDHGVCYGRSK